MKIKQLEKSKQAKALASLASFNNPKIVQAILTKWFNNALETCEYQDLLVYAQTATSISYDGMIKFAQQRYKERTF